MKVGATRLKKAIGMGFNDARHSFITWWSKQKTRNNDEKREMARLMHTSKALLEQYIRYGVLIDDSDDAPEVKKPMTRAQLAKLKAEKGSEEDEEDEEDDDDSDEEPPTPPPAKKKGKKKKKK
jgi:hypothetical protein